jgi:hypothetical protein
MKFLKHADEDITKQELCVFISNLPAEAMVVYKNGDYKYTQYLDPDVSFESNLLVTQLNFLESCLYSVGKMNAKILFANVLSKRRVLMKTPSEHSKFSTLGTASHFVKVENRVRQALIHKAADERKQLTDYYYMSWVLHDETLDTDTIITLDDVVMDSEVFRQIKAMVFEWQYTSSVLLAEEKYEQLRTLKDVTGQNLIPPLEQLSEEQDEES